MAYTEGRGVPQDFKEAAKWFREAAEQGMTRAQISLASLYYKGKGVPHDFVQAHMWSNVAAVGSDKEYQEGAAQNRELVAKKMTVEQIAEAQKLAREWLVAHQKK